MPRYSLRGTFEKVSGLNDVYLLFVSQSTVELINTLFLQGEWDVMTPEDSDIYRLASEEISTMANLSDLVDVLGEIRECICALNLNTTVQQYALPPDYEGEHPGYVSGAEFNENTQVPDPIALQGYDDWPLYQEYTCKAVEMIRRSAVIMCEELLRITDLPALGLGVVAAVLGTVTAILATLALPAIVMGVSLCATLGAAIIAAGQGGLEATRDYLLDASNTVWRNIACIVRSAPNSVIAEEQVKEYIEQTAPTIAKPILLLFPWKSWINQVYLGVTVDGETIDVTGLDSLCDGCSPEPGEELVTDPEINDASQVSYYLHPDSPCQTMPTHNGSGITSPSCHVPFTMLSTNIEILTSDLGNNLNVSWTMFKAGTSPGSVMAVTVERIETGVVYASWERTNQAGVWLGDEVFTTGYAGMYRVTMKLNHSQSYFDRISVRR